MVLRSDREAVYVHEKSSPWQAQWYREQHSLQISYGRLNFLILLIKIRL